MESWYPRLVVFLLLLACAREVDADSPNIVLILADDQSYRDFGFLGNDLVHTPSIDRLAAASARYPNAYVPMSVCRPSLATLLTGLYPHQHGIHFNHPPPGLGIMRRTMTAQQYEQTRATTDYLIKNVPTLPRILASHGYTCLQTGKHWEGSYQTAGFTHGMTLGRPAARLGPVTGTRLQDNGDRVAHGNGDAGLVIGRETMQPIFDFLNSQPRDQPFFVWYAPFLPHTPFDAPPRFHELYRDRDVPAPLRPLYAEIARFDETVGQLLSHMESKHQMDNTMIVFVSDNGFRPHESVPNRHNLRSKLSQYEDGLRTPILIRWDGHVVPAEHSQLVSTIDIVPTILSAAGMSHEVTTRMMGLDLMPSATGRASLPDRPVFGSIFPNDAEVLNAPSRHARGRWIREGRYKLIVPGPASNPVAHALFDLQQDPLESTNLVTDPQHAAAVHRLTRLLDAWWPPDDDTQIRSPE